MKVLVNEQLSPHKFKTPEGYLICTDAILARTGKQTYKRGEVFGVDCTDAESEIEIDRPEEEVFSEKTLASFENKPITVEHPDEDVNSSNWKDYQVGFVRDVKRGKTRTGEDVILGTLVIQDKDTIDEIMNGEHTELSCGYDCDINDEANPCQRNIRGNHVALCQQGRAGIAKIVDSIKDNDLPEKEDSTYRYSDAWGREIFVTKWDNNEYLISGGKENFNEKSMTKREVENYLDSCGAKFSRTFDSVKDAAVPDVTVQCYILDGMKILIQDRVGPVWKGLAVPGGHVEEDESFEQACVREVKEETGLEVDNIVRFDVETYKCDDGRIGVAILYKTHSFNGTLRDSNEGKMMWMDIEEVLNSDKTAEGFKDLLRRCCKTIELEDSVKDAEYMGIPYPYEVWLSYKSGRKFMAAAYKTHSDARHNVDRLRNKFKEKNDVPNAEIREVKDSVKDINPHKGESKEDFISRFMSETKSEYPDEKQRLAVAYSYWNKKDSMKDAGTNQEQLAQREYKELKRQYNELNESLEENEKNPRYNSYATRKKIDEVLKKIDDLKKNFGYALDDCSKTKDASYTTKTKQGYDIIEMWRDGGRIHIIFRRANDYGIGLGYNSLDGTWGQGIYNLPDLQAAKNTLKEEKPNARQIQDSKKYEVSYKDSKGNIHIQIVRASSMKDAVIKFKRR